jgi:N,N'-diacetyllegionaminate synthase
VSTARLLKIGARAIGAGQPAYLVAEIGINHNGDLDLARRSIDAAKAAGADAVKFQNFRTEDFVSDRALTFTYRSQGRTITEPQYDMFKRVELSPEMLRRLAEHAGAVGIDFHSTPTSREGVDALVALGCDVIKNGSDYLGHHDLIRAMGETGRVVVLSSGMATLAEIDDAVRALRSTGNDKLVLLHCVSSYPAPDEAINLRRIPALAVAFDCLVGFSDHSAGITAAQGAVALGACWIEKHFTFDRALPGPDHWFSSDPAEFRRLVDGVRAMETMLGNARIEPTAAETEMRQVARLSCVAARALRAGHVLAPGDVAYRRPATGLPPAMAAFLVGRRLKRDVSANAALQLEWLD